MMGHATFSRLLKAKSYSQRVAKEADFVKEVRRMDIAIHQEDANIQQYEVTLINDNYYVYRDPKWKLTQQSSPLSQTNTTQPI